MLIDLLTEASRQSPDAAFFVSGGGINPDRDAMAGARGGAPGMSPVAIGGCFGWLHTDPVIRADVAILICPALNRDALDSHHGLRLLADDCAAAGYATLRFDYPGIGDSCEPSGDHWTAWQRSVDEAADWLRQATGARRLLFCGLRVGATLAALAAASRQDMAGLILLAPVLRGRSYVRQLQIEAQLLARTHGRRPSAPPDGADVVLEFHELSLSRDTIEHISAADLSAIRLPAGLPVAIHAQSPSLLLDTCAAAWTKGGALVSRPGFAGLEPLLQHNLVEECAPPDFSAILAWLSRTVPAHVPRCGLRQNPVRISPAVLLPPGCRETPLRFGPGGRLFGMLCEPAGSDVADTPVVIIANSGRDPHYGFARFGVMFARRLAGTGIASLRLDFAGLGDSIGPPGRERRHSHMFEVDRRPDLRAALDALEQFGYRRFAVQGSCAGAYHGLHAAVADPRIGTLLLVNLPVFEWRPGDTVDFVNRRTARPGRFLAKLIAGHTWARLRRGEIHVRRFLRAQLQREAARLGGIGGRVLQRLGIGRPPSPAWAAMAALGGRGTRTLFLFAQDDSGLDAMELEFGRHGAHALAFAGTEIAVVPDLDHQLSTQAMRATAAGVMIDFLTRPNCRAKG